MAKHPFPLYVVLLIRNAGFFCTASSKKEHERLALKSKKLSIGTRISLWRIPRSGMQGFARFLLYVFMLSSGLSFGKELQM